MDSTAGERLKKIRLEKGVSLEEVHKKTKVHLNILKAIEGDSLTHLSPVYLQGFIKVYCNYLGVDPRDYIVIKETKRKVPVASASPVSVNKPVQSELPKNKPSYGTPLKTPDFLKNASVRLGSFKPSEKIKRGVVLIVVVVIGLLVIFNVGKFFGHLINMAKVSAAQKAESKQTQNTAKAAAKLQAQEAKPSAKNPAVASGTQTAATLLKKEATEILLVIKARENCWLNLKSDGKLVFHRVLEKGRSESWKAKDRMDLAVGNAGAVELEINGQLFSNLGRKGQALKNIVITKKGIEIK